MCHLNSLQAQRQRSGGRLTTGKMSVATVWDQLMKVQHNNLDPSSWSRDDDVINSSSSASLEETTDHSCWAYGNYDVILAAKLNPYISLVLVFVGLVGNALNVVVFRKYLGKHSPSVFIFVLAISDSVYLITVFLSRLLATLRCLHAPHTSIDFINRNNILCKLFQFLMDWSSDCSSMLILCFTIERFIAVRFPMRVKQWCTIGRTKRICAAICLFVAVAIAPHHWLMMESRGRACAVSRQWEYEFSLIYFCETLLFKIIPVCAISILNMSIIHKVHRKSYIREIVTETNENGSGNRNLTGSANSTGSDHNRQLTVILILISGTYVLLYFPVLVHYFLWSLMRHEVLSLSHKAMNIALQCTTTLYIAGFAVNFFLYSVASSVFRQNIRNALSCC